jgi:hypothetical protein
MTSAMKAGWICLGIGLVSAWIFPPAYVFLSVAILMGTIAMATHQVKSGLILFISGFAAIGFSMLVTFLVFTVLFATAAEHLHKTTRMAPPSPIHFEKSVNQIQTIATDALKKAGQPKEKHAQADAPKPINSMSAPELLKEIARLESERRDCNATGRAVPAGLDDKLQQLRTVYDAKPAQ